MSEPVLSSSRGKAVPLILLRKSAWEGWLKRQSAHARTWAEANRFTAKEGATLTLPDDKGGIEAVWCGISETPDIWSIAALPKTLPEGVYAIEGEKLSPQILERLALGWWLGSYDFTLYKKKPAKPLAQLKTPAKCNLARIRRMAEAVFLVRDLINLPPNDLGPPELAARAKEAAEAAGAKCKVIHGDALLTQNYPTIHAVGRASAKAPCLIDLRWGNPKHPRLTLVGKGVTFDTGGLDIKPSSNMELMKKDMGGAAHALALGLLVIGAKLPVRLRVLIPAVENAVSGDAYRTSDVIRTRKGLTVEVGNTDAEGRLILCDALAEADGESPELLLDFATLTGAARVALGTEMPALFSTDPKFTDALMRHAEAERDALWPLPLWEGYRSQLDSKIADLKSTGGSYGGAITAALFLKSFVEKAKTWAHLDMMAWNLSAKPGRPAGGEAQTLRTLLAYLEERFGK